MATVTSKLVSGTNYKVEAQAGGFTLVSDQDQSVGGNGTGPSPKDFLLAAIGACTIQTIRMVAAKRKWDVQEMSVTVTISEIDDPSKPAGSNAKITLIEELIEVKGSLSQADLDAIEKTAGRCPVLKIITEPKLVQKRTVKV
jgi:putative redox protein